MTIYTQLKLIRNHNLKALGVKFGEICTMRIISSYINMPDARYLMLFSILNNPCYTDLSFFFSCALARMTKFRQKFLLYELSPRTESRNSTSESNAISALWKISRLAFWELKSFICFLCRSVSRSYILQTTVPTIVCKRKWCG